MNTCFVIDDGFASSLDTILSFSVAVSLAASKEIDILKESSIIRFLSAAISFWSKYSSRCFTITILSRFCSVWMPFKSSGVNPKSSMFPLPSKISCIDKSIPETYTTRWSTPILWLFINVFSFLACFKISSLDLTRILCRSSSVTVAAL